MPRKTRTKELQGLVPASLVPQPELSPVVREVLLMAGFRPEHLRHAYQRAVDALDAYTTRFAARNGEITDERTITDFRTRLRAAREIFSLIPGMRAPERAAPEGISVDVVVLAPDGTRTAVRLRTGKDET